MSEHITHIAVYEDACSLIAFSPSFPQVFKTSVSRYPDCGLMASASRGNHLHALPILARVKDKDQPTEDDLKLMAAALGWIIHRAADLTVKPLYRITGKEYAVSGIPEYVHEIYHDAATFRYVYDEGRRKSVSPHVHLSAATLEEAMKSHPASKVVDAESVEFLVAGLVHGDLMGLQHFSTQAPKDLNSALNTFFARRQRLYEDLRIYIQAYQDPDANLYRKFVTDSNYYNEQDELLRLVRSLQKGKAEASISLDAALEQAPKQSIYTQALHRSYQFLDTARKYFTDEISASAAYDALEIFPKEHRLVN
ncbi:hypothetical protein D770_10030 [Flammeovirgaceae bacterium 311]|nr:hypothetical protein D770_10030 [Flammeovirgaceae bacterium 311]